MCAQYEADTLSVLEILPKITVINLKCPIKDRPCLCSFIKEQRAVEDCVSQQSLRKVERQGPEWKMHSSALIEENKNKPRILFSFDFHEDFDPPIELYSRPI